MAIDAEAHHRMTKAKTRILMDQPFFAVIIAGLEYIDAVDVGLQKAIPTMATDGKRVWYNPEFVNKLTVNEIAGVIMHEGMHVAWLHHLRRGNRHPKIWNFACDFAINHVVLDAGQKLPGDALFDEKYLNWTAYEIYDDLMKNVKQIKIKFSGAGTKMPNKGENGEGEGEGEPNDDPDELGDPLWGTVIDLTDEKGNPLSPAERAEIEEEVKILVQQAAQTAKQRGKLPGSLAGLIEAVGKPKIDWKNYIQTWVKGTTPDNYTWIKPNRKIMANYGIYMPQMQLNGAGVGVLSIDTSGSVSDNELIQYVNEIIGVIEMCNPDKLYIIQHDAIIQDVMVWEAGQEFKNLKVKGRGGTCIQPSFEYLKTIDEQVDWMICFTDMGICDYPSASEAPDYPVLWCATGPDNAPFGTYLPIKDAM